VSDVMLHGILNMPPGIWDNSDIHKAQRYDAYKQASKRILELEKKLQNANEDKLSTISAERKRWAREDLLAIKIGNLEQQAKGIEDAVNKLEQPDVPGAPVLIINYDLLEFAGLLRNQAKALKDQGNG
jgi:hypothetical protein